MKLSLSLVALSLAACAAHTSTTAATTVGAAPTGPRALHKGEALDGVLHLGEDHAFAIALAPGEDIHFDITSTRGEPGCGNWGWMWKSPEGATVTENPLDIADDKPTHQTVVDVAAKVADAGDMAPHGGTWMFHLAADVANCKEIRYRIAAR